MALEYLYVGIGGAVGAVARGLTCSVFDKLWKKKFPLAVFVINVIGCAIIGLTSEIHNLNRGLSLAITTGFCGGFTTWSTFASQTLKLAMKKEYAIAIASVAANHVLGGVAAYLGQLIGRACRR